MKTSTDQPVCGLVDPELVAQVVGPGELRTTGEGAVSLKARAVRPASCSIAPADGSRPIVQVRIGEVVDSADFWRKRLKQEAEKAGCDLRYTDDPGYGYTCDYDSGLYNPGSSVEVLRGDRIIRVVAYKWSGSTHNQRVEIGEKIALSADENLTTYDKK
ncbi:hypothetical protein [Aeromicrobium sp.]|uniref:hypothetical protein n=1 Tax=Aeromicrobium sp. TaxID=1871063 RepID=UPI0030BD0CF5